MALTSKFFAVFVLSMMSIDFSGSLIIRAAKPEAKVFAARELDLVGEILGFLGSAFVGLLTLIWEILKWMVKMRFFSRSSHCHSSWGHGCGRNRNVGVAIADACLDVAFKNKNHNSYGHYHDRANRRLSVDGALKGFLSKGLAGKGKGNTPNDQNTQGLEEVNFIFSKTLYFEDEIESPAWADKSPNDFKKYLTEETKKFQSTLKQIQDGMKKENAEKEKHQNLVNQADAEIKKGKDVEKFTKQRTKAQGEVESHQIMIEILEKDLAINTEKYKKDRIVSMMSMALRSFRQKVEDEFEFKNDAKSKKLYDQYIKDVESTDPVVADNANKGLAELYGSLSDIGLEKLMQGNGLRLAQDLAAFGMTADEAKDKMTRSVLKTFIIMLMKAQLVKMGSKMKEFKEKKAEMAKAASNQSVNPLVDEVLDEFQAMKTIMTSVDGEEMVD